MPSLPKRFLEHPEIGTRGLNQAPEPRRMVHFPGMAKLMDHDVADERRVQKQELGIQADRFAPGTTSPARALASHGGAGKGLAHLPADLLEHGQQVFATLAQPPAMQGRAAGN